MKLNLGCGDNIVEGWVNVDYSIGAKFAKLPFFTRVNKKLKLFNITWSKDIYLHDLTKRFPWENNSIDVIYCSHTLEHFSREEGYNFLSECFRVLKSGGIIRIVVPDLMKFVTNYMEGKIKADEFVQKLGVLYDRYDNPIKNKLAPFIQFPHKCMYDTPTLLSILCNIGFNATSKNPYESNIHDIKKIELKERTLAAVIIEGVKI